MTSKVIYSGQLRTQCTHLASGNQFITDAPIDNNGKGEAFSPTDAVATALASCMFTIMGIKAQHYGWVLDGSTAEVTKIMVAEPRRISAVEIIFYMKGNFDDKAKQILENAARTCPVWYSLHPDLKKDVIFKWE